MDEKDEAFYDDGIERIGPVTIKGPKRITLKLYKETHAKLKIISTINEKTIDKMASEIIEEEVKEIDVVEIVEKGLKKLKEPEDVIYSEEDEEKLSMAEEALFPRKKVTIDVDSEIHKKLKIIASAEDESLGSVASKIIESKLDETDVVKLVADEFN